GDQNDTAIAATIGVSRQLVSRWHARWRATRASASATDIAYGAEIETVEMRLEDLYRGRPKEPATAGSRWYKPGRREVQITAITESLARGSSRTAAFAAAGVPKSTAWGWLQTDAAFREAVERAEAEMVRAVSGRIYDIAMTGPPNVAWVSGMTLLERL